MKKAILITVLIVFSRSLFAIVPPFKKDIKLPEEMRNNLKDNPAFYMPQKGFIKTIQNFRASKSTGLRKTNAAQSNSLSLAIPVLCAQYSDVTAEWPETDLQAELFGNWPTGSMADYYDDVSYGQFQLTGQVYGWYQVSGTSQYYERDNGNTGELLKELFELSDESVDYTQYDNDGPDGVPNSGDDDGFVDVIAIVHSGEGGERGGPGIWSHSWSYQYYYFSPFVTNDVGINGNKIKINDYIIQPAVEEGDMVKIGVFCHEFGHALGLPDLYDRDDEGETSEGVGNWCLMAGGSYGGDGNSPEYPAHMSAWCKEALGWITPVVPDENLSNQALPAVEDSSVFFKLWTHGDITPYIFNSGLDLSINLGREYFLVENRQKKGFDRNLEGEGLLIWHIDNSVRGWNDDENHKLVDLEAADGRVDLDFERNDGDTGDPFPGITDNRNFNRTSRPNSLSYNLANSKVAVENISDSGDIMFADLSVVADDIDFLSYNLDDFEGDGNGFLDPGESARLYVDLKNYGQNVTSVTAVLTTDDPDIQITDSVAVYSGIEEDGSGVNDLDAFALNASANASRHPINCKLKINSDRDYYTEIDLVVMMENIFILLVDDSYGEKTESGVSIMQYYTDALDQLGIDYYDTHQITIQGTPDSTLLKKYGTVIWFTGSQRNTLSATEQRYLISYLENGGNFFISGQNIGSDLVLTGNISDNVFYEKYLHAKLLQDNASSDPQIMLTGIIDDPITDGFRPYFFITEGNGADNQTSPDIIEPINGATSLFNYFGTGLMGKNAAIKYQGDYQLVYLAFSFEAINEFGSSVISRTELVDNVLTWFNTENQVSGVSTFGSDDLVATHYELWQNFPNPFNPETVIRFQLPKSSHVSLKVYDVLGREIKTLINKLMNNGIQDVVWNGTDNFNRHVSSGVYLYRIKTDDFTDMKKMILIR